MVESRIFVAAKRRAPAVPVHHAKRGLGSRCCAKKFMLKNNKRDPKLLTSLSEKKKASKDNESLESKLAKINYLLKKEHKMMMKGIEC